MEASMCPMSICCPHRHCCVHRDGQHLCLRQLHPPGAGVLEGESPVAARVIDFLCRSSADLRSGKGLSRPRSLRPTRRKEDEDLQPALSSELHTYLQLRTHGNLSLSHIHTIKKTSTHLQAHSWCLGAVNNSMPFQAHSRYLGAVNNSMPLQAHSRCLRAVGHRLSSRLLLDFQALESLSHLYSSS